MRVLTLSLLLFAFGVASASAAPIGATVIHQQGSATVFSTAQGKRLALREGDRVAEGDRIRTGDDGSVEIEFDTGSIIKIDTGTDLVVKSLRRDEKGSTFSVFGLLFGRVKSAVRKLVSSDSRFEYQTKAVVAGVAGTPPWVISAGQDGVVEVDLLGAKGDAGAVFVQGLDPKKTLVNLSPGTGTRVFAGSPPPPPTPLSAERFRRLDKGIPFVARPRLNSASEGKMTTEEALGSPKDEEKKVEEGAPSDEPGEKKEPEAKPGEEQPAEEPGENKEPVAPPEEEKKTEQPKAPEQAGLGDGAGGEAPPTPRGVAHDMAINGIQRVISTPVLTAPDKVNTATGIENTGASSQGTVGQDVKTGGDNAPPPQTKTIKILIDLK